MSLKTHDEDFYTFRMNASGDIESEQNISCEYLNSDSSVYRSYSWCSVLLMCFDCSYPLLTHWARIPGLHDIPDLHDLPPPCR